MIVEALNLTARLGGSDTAGKRCCRCCAQAKLTEVFFISSTGDISLKSALCPTCLLSVQFIVEKALRPVRIQ